MGLLIQNGTTLMIARPFLPVTRRTDVLNVAGMWYNRPTPIKRTGIVAATRSVSHDGVSAMTTSDCTPQVKTCKDCGDTKPISEFGPQSDSRDGLRSQCRPCFRRYMDEWRRNNPDRVKAHAANRKNLKPIPAGQIPATKRCHQCGTEKPSAQFWRDKRNRTDGLQNWCIECRKKYTAEWREANPDKVRGPSRKRRRYPPDERSRARARRWDAKNRERKRAYDRWYTKAFPEKHLARVHRRRARLRGAPVVEHFTRDEIFRRDKGICHVCGKKADPNNWHLDHLVPLAEGGEHSRRNVAVAHPLCNQTRGTTGPAQLRLLG